MIALLPPPSKLAGTRRSDFRRYLGDSGGKDVLTFDTGDKARLAADYLRALHPGLKIEARYTKVFVSL